MGMTAHIPLLLALCVFLVLFVFELWPCGSLTFWLWRHRKAPLPQRRAGPRGDLSPHCVHARTKPAWVRRKVVYLAIHLRSCRKVADVFNRWHGCTTTVGKTWVAEVMKESAEEIDRLRREMRRRPAPMFSVGHTWALDLTFARSLEGATFTILGVIDQGSRRVLCLKALPTKCAFALLGHLFIAISQFGLPTAIRTDNEGMFVSKLWNATLHALAIAHRRGPPAQPWRNGRIERLFGTLKPLLLAADVRSRRALTSALNEFVLFYNTVRPHQALGALTPLEVWRGETLADVQEAHSHKEGRWVQALDGLLVGYQH